MSKGYLLIDGSNIAYAAASTKRLSVGDQDTHAIYGVLRTLRPLIANYSMLTSICLWDGRSWRYDKFPEYKARRNKEPETKTEKMQAGIKLSLKQQLPLIKKALALLGVPQIVAMNLEADDMAAILVRKYQPMGKKIMLISGDKDWLQLVGPGVGWFDVIHNKRVTAKTLKEIIGVELPAQWPEVKALMGDISDDVPGVGGIGEKGAIELVSTYGSVGAFRNQIIDGTIKIENLPKKFQDFANDEDKQATFIRNVALMDLNSPEIPAPINLKVSKDPMNRSAFHDFCEELLFNSITKDIDTWVSPFVREAA